MRKIINGKLYDSCKCEELASKDCYNNGNQSGTIKLLLASDGQLLIEIYSNGQDLYLQSGLHRFQDCDFGISNFASFSDSQASKMVDLGLIEIVD